MEYNQVGLVAETDQALARLAQYRRRPPDGGAEAALLVSGDLAAVIAAEFGGDRAVAGRVLVSAAGKLAGLSKLLQAACWTGGDPAERNLPPLLINVLGFAGEQLARDTGAP